MSDFKSLEQKRAELAWEFVDWVKKEKTSAQKDYKSVMRKLPAMILTSGLGQTLAFHLGKESGKPERDVINNLAKALKDLTGYVDKDNARELLKTLSDSQHEAHVMLTNEALKYATWLKRLAEAELEG